MRSIAAGISSNAWMIRNAVQSAVNGINVSVSGIAGKAASSAKRNSMVGLATGGFVKTTGIAVLHPNEVVVNDTLTKRLGLFLDDYTKSTASTPTSPNSVVITPPDPNDTRPTGRPPVVPVPSPVNTGRDNVRTEQPSTPQIDNSVTFAAGSVVIQLANATEAELEKAAEKLMKIIARKQQLKNMATRTV